MSKEGMVGMDLATQELLSVAETLTDEQWHLPSSAQGWSVKDAVVHAGCLMAYLMEAVSGAAVPGIGIEALNDVRVAEKRGLDGAGTMAYVRQELAAAQAAFAPMQEEPLASTTAPLQDLGTYPLHAIVDMFTFDITTHLRYDIVKPRGPIDVSLPPLDDRRLGPAVSWLLGGIPQMQPDLPKEFAGPVGLDLTGPAGTRVVIGSDGTAITVMPGPTRPPSLGRSSPRQPMTSWRGRLHDCPGSGWYRWGATVMRQPASLMPSTLSRRANTVASGRVHRKGKRSSE